MIALLPLKEFAAAKQRLSGLLSAAERAQLFQAMVEDVLAVLTAHSGIERVVICSRDHSALWLARYYAVEFIDEAELQRCDELRRGEELRCREELKCWDLNSAVNLASSWLREQQDDVVVVHGDLPMLHSDDISEFLRAHRNGAESAVTVAPDRRRSGTNLLAWRSLSRFSAQYGVDSFSRHCEHARELGVAPTVCDLIGASCDIDEPEDLGLLLQRNDSKVAANTRHFLTTTDVAERVALMQSAAVNCGERDICA